MKVGDILRKKQPDVYKKLNKKKKKKERKEHLSFKYIDYLMRNNKGVDETKCRGRF